MPTLNITQTYVTGNVLNKADLDNICTSLTTFVNSTKLDSSNVQTGGLIGANLANATVTATQLAASVAGSGLTGGAGTALAVVVDNSTLKIASNQVQLGNPNVAVSLSSNSFSTSSQSFTDVTGLSATLATRGRVVLLLLNSTAGGNLSFAPNFSSIGISTLEAGFQWQIVRGGSTIIASGNADSYLQSPSNVLKNMAFTLPPSAVAGIDVSAPTGSTTYKLQVLCNEGAMSVSVNSCNLVAFEL